MEDDQTIYEHQTFRVILSAMSHPGRVFRLPEFSSEETAVVELLQCLVDNEVGVAVVGEPALARSLARRTGCRLVPSREADFVIVGNGSNSAEVPDFKSGSLEYPDSGATVIYLVDGLSEGEGGIVLTGPGINDTVRLRISGLAEGELPRLRRINSHFPLGIDALFFVPRRNGRLACIPRSSRIGDN